MNRENINQFLEEKAKLLYVPKNGGLCDYVLNLLPEIGIPVEGKLNKNMKFGNLEIVLARGEDIPKRVEEQNKKGRIAYGLTGDDLFDEYRLSNGLNLGFIDGFLGVLNTYDWFDKKAKFYRPALCLLNKTGSIDDIPYRARVAVNKKYELTSTRFISQNNLLKRKDLIIIEYAGGTEETVADGTNEACVDIVYSGKSLEDNNLKIVGPPFRFSDISLIGINNVWEYEFSRIIERAKNPTNSFTSKALKDSNEIVKKIGSESAEVIQAYIKKENLVDEVIDLIYANMLALVNSGKKWWEIETGIIERWK